MSFPSESHQKQPFREWQRGPRGRNEGFAGWAAVPHQVVAVEPGTCIAAWTAIDPCDAENGGMMVVPKTNHYDVVCPEQADPGKSFTKHYVRPPAGTKPVLVEMQPGDTLIFNGSVIHGSGPNRSKDRFRRSLICHYATGNAERISSHYLPCLTFEGAEVSIETNEAGGVCGEPYSGHAH